MARRWTTLILLAAVLASAFAAPFPAQARTAGAGGSPATDVAQDSPGSAVAIEWNAIATRTIFTENATPVPSAPLYFGFVSLAMYDAVVAVEGRYEPYAAPRKTPRAYELASSEVAAATAAYRVLRHYYPSSSTNLRRDYRSFLAEHPRGVATTLGKRVGERAARDLIRLRRDDGRDAAVTLTAAPAAGVWRPTPPAHAPMAVPWLGHVTPLLLDSAHQIALPGPDALTSPEYAADLAEVRAYGSAEPSSRTAEQTATALFYNANVVAQYQAAMRGTVGDRGLDLVESARAFALLNASMADTLICTWREKLDEPYWRPVTAIRLADTDGNDATAPDPTWTPLAPTPPYPEYPSGHASVTGATTGTLAHLFGADGIDVTVPSLTSAPARDYATTEALDTDTVNARIWLGFHFRAAMTDANDLGHAVVDWATGHYFRPMAR